MRGRGPDSWPCSNMGGGAGQGERWDGELGWGCRLRRIVLFVGLVCGALSPGAAEAQLRPLDPVDWSLFEPGMSVQASLGMGLLQRQRASLAGVEGRLVEWGNFSIGLRSGRVAIIASGTGVRSFSDGSRFADPVPGVKSDLDARRNDAGDYRIDTIIRITPNDWPAVLALRFGTRLPTTDDGVGLDRDQTDFFATLAGQVKRSAFAFSAEAGVGVHGTIDRDYEQADVLLYSAAAEWDRGGFRPFIALAGQVDGFDGWEIRGNEDLGELRLGVRVGKQYAVRVAWVAGYRKFSPRHGLLLSAELLR